MPDRPPLRELTSEQLSELAAGYVAMAAVTKTPGTKEAFGRLAERYANLAAQRKIEEQRAKPRLVS